MADSPKRTRTIKVRVTDAELAELRARAGDQELAAWLRAVGLGSRPARRKPAGSAAADPVLLASLGRIGNNLNQLARLANTTRQLPTLVALAGIEAQLQEVARCTSSS